MLLSLLVILAGIVIVSLTVVSTTWGVVAVGLTVIGAGVASWPVDDT